MREPGDVVAAAFPRPGPVLTAVLAVIGIAAILGAIVVHWAPGGDAGNAAFLWAAFVPSRPLWHPWTILTSGIVTNPASFGHAIWSLIGLYFLTTDLEKKWGASRLIRFLVISVLFGNLLVLLVDRIFGLFSTPTRELFHPGVVMGPGAAIAAIAIAWAKENADRQIRLFFFLPVKGKTILWFTLGFAVLLILFNQPAPEGAMAPFGGILAGLAFGGSPSPARSLWLRIRLGKLRRSKHALTVESLLGDDAPGSARRAAAKRKPGGPALRILQGGADDDKKKPKDKRYLN